MRIFVSWRATGTSFTTAPFDSPLWLQKEKHPPWVLSFLVDPRRIDSRRLDARSVIAALTCRRHVIHYRSLRFSFMIEKRKAPLSLCILSGEIGGGSTEAWICLGISVFGRCYDAMASEVLTVCCSLNPTVKTMSISLPSVRDHFSFFSWT